MESVKFNLENEVATIILDRYQKRNAFNQQMSNEAIACIEQAVYRYWSYVLGIHKIKELFFTAATIDAQDAYAAGIFNHIVPTEQLETKVMSIVEKIKACVPEGIANTKMQLNMLCQALPLTESQKTEIQKSRQALLSSPEFLGRVQNLLEKVHRNH